MSSMGNASAKVGPQPGMSKKAGKETKNVTKDNLKFATCIFEAKTRINVVGNVSPKCDEKIITAKKEDRRSRKTSPARVHLLEGTDDPEALIDLQGIRKLNKENSRPASRRGSPRPPSRNQGEQEDSSKSKPAKTEKKRDKKNSERKSLSQKHEKSRDLTTTKKSNVEKKNSKSNEDKGTTSNTSKQKVVPPDGSKKTKKRSVEGGKPHSRSTSESRNGKKGDNNGVNNNNDGKQNISVAKLHEESYHNANNAEASSSGSESDHSLDGIDASALQPEDGVSVMPWHVIPHPRVVQFWNIGPAGLLVDNMQKYPVEWFKLPGEDDIPVTEEGKFARPYKSEEWRTVNEFLRDVQRHLEPEDISNPALKKYLVQCRAQSDR